MVDTAGSWGNPINKKGSSNQGMAGSQSQNLQGKIDITAINKDNIFSSDILTQLMPKSISNTSTKVEETQANKENNKEGGINKEKTDQLTSYLSSLGFNLGMQPLLITPQNIKEEEPEKLQIMARSKEGIFLVNDDDNNYFTDQTKLICEAGNASVFSSDGSMLAV